MKQTLQCPKCDGRALWRIERLQQRSLSAGGQSEIVPLALAFRGGGWLSLPDGIGALELFACARCGFAELYADTSGLRPDVERGVHFIDTEPQAGLR